MAKRNMCPLEWEEQKALIQWLKLMPAISRHVIKITNEGDRTAHQGYFLHQQGLCAGASDLFIAYPVGPSHGLFLEIKRNRSYPPSETSKPVWERQRRFIETMRSVGYEAQFAFGFDMAKSMIENYLMNGRAMPDPDALPPG